MDADRPYIENLSSNPLDSSVERLDHAAPIILPERQPSQQRPISEKRRLQNRQAQRNYRDKQKRRLEALESLVERQTHEARQSDSLSIDNSAEPFTLSEEFHMPAVSSSSEQINHFVDEESTKWGLGIDSFEAFADNSDLYPLQLLQSSFDKHTQSPNARDTPITNNYHGQTISDQSKSWPTAMAKTTIKTSDTKSMTSTAINDSLNSFLSHFLASKTSISVKLANKIAQNEITLQDILGLGLEALESNFTSAADTEYSLQCQTRHDQRAKNNTYTGSMPNLRPSIIRVTQVSFLSACLSNAAMLGLTPASTTNDAESPFYGGKLSKQAMEWSNSGFKDIKPDLRPTKNQLAYSHHPYLDVLPFPTFRERAIGFIHADPPVFDEEELCYDLLNDALVCWGSSLGAHVGNSGAPWDIRSWEARPWFMKKWWFLIGGAEGELYQQTRWWREMRGDSLESTW